MKLKKLLNGTPFAHRGLHNKEVMENSIESFERALEAGYGIELDVRMTHDNILITFHDKDIKELTGHTLPIEEIKYSELINFGVPKLEDVFKLIEKKSGKALIEIKESPFKKEIRLGVSSLIKQHKFEYAVISFDPRTVKWFKKNGYIAGLSIEKGYSKKILNIIVKGLVKYANPDFLVVEKSLLVKKSIKHARNKMKIIAWTIKSKNEKKKIEHFSDNYIFDEF